MSSEPASTTENAIASLTVDKVSKAFGAREILKEVSFEVADGEFCVLLGPSGCGKTTLLRIVAGLETASAGEIRIDGARVDALAPRDRDIAFVFQNYALYPHMTVFDNLSFSLRLRGTPKGEIRARVTEAAQMLEIERQLEHKPQQLSGGQRQRVALGRAIVRRPKLFLFDEPLSNLDAILRAGMRLELARLKRRLSATMIYVTHDQAEAMTLGEKIVVLDRGELQQIGAPADIYHRPRNLFVAGFVGQPQMNFIDGRAGGDGKFHSEAGLEFDLAAAGAARVAADAPVTAGIRAEDLGEAQGGSAHFGGTVEFVEDLGSDRFVHARRGEQKLVARLPAQSSVALGESIAFGVDPARIHLFQQGRRVN